MGVAVTGGDEHQRAARSLVGRMVEATGLAPSELAVRAGLSASTLTRFLNQPVKHTLSLRTLAKLSAFSGVPIPPLGAGPTSDGGVEPMMAEAPGGARRAPTAEEIEARDRLISALLGINVALTGALDEYLRAAEEVPPELVRALRPALAEVARRRPEMREALDGLRGRGA